MIKKIVNSITKPPIKPFVNSAKKFLEIIKEPHVAPLDRFDKSKSAIERNLLERKIAHLEKMIEQGQKMNRPVEGEIKYRDKLKKDLENFDRIRKINKAEEAEKVRKAEEAEKTRKAEEAEKVRKAEEAEKTRKAEEAEKVRKAEEAEKLKEAEECKKAEESKKEKIKGIKEDKDNKKF